MQKLLSNKLLRVLLFLALAGMPIAFFQNCGGIKTAAKLGGSSALSASVTGNLAINLTWTAPSTGAPTGYYIEQSQDGTNFVQIQQVAGSATSTTISNLSRTKFYFRVSSFNSAAESTSQILLADLTNK